MTGETNASTAPPSETASTAGRVSFERLRERTDELELLISGLSLLALLSLPGWLSGVFEDLHARLPLGLLAGAVILLPIVTAIAYVMAGLFMLHLAVRAHWVGLIGLKSIFPQGVRWERLQGIGPVTLEHLRARGADVDRGIARADRLASLLFSLITFSAISLVVLGAWMTLLFLIGGVFGTAVGGTNSFINIAVGVLVQAVVGIPLLRWLCDGVLARRVPRLRDWSPFRALIRTLGLLEALFFPPRLLGVTRLALQSNLLPRLFFVLFLLAMLGLVMASNHIYQSGRGLDVFGTQRFVAGSDLLAGLRSSHYEAQRIPRDRVRAVPMIPAPVIETAWLPLFLPYVALIDDPVLRQRCPPREDRAGGPVFWIQPNDSDEAAFGREARDDVRSLDAAACLARLWQVRLDGRELPLDGFLVSERADLGLRGLSGWLPLNGLAPGPHRLEVIWRPRPEQDAIAEDYVPRRMRHVILFLWSPEAAALPAAAD